MHSILPATGCHVGYGAMGACDWVGFRATMPAGTGPAANSIAGRTDQPGAENTPEAGHIFVQDCRARIGRRRGWSPRARVNGHPCVALCLAMTRRAPRFGCHMGHGARREGGHEFSNLQWRCGTRGLATAVRDGLLECLNCSGGRRAIQARERERECKERLATAACAPQTA